MAPVSQPPDVHAAGAVVTRSGREVLLVHRPKYDDWSFPKGKLEPGEHVTAAAVREVAEETGLDVRLGPPLLPQRYRVAGGMKTVDYWVGRVIGDDDVKGFVPTDEIDKVRWVPIDKAMAQLTYRIDRGTLEESLAVRKKTRALVVLRHAKARARGSWRGDDRKRPLLKVGTLQAQRLVPVLSAYDVTTLASSSSVRCVQTVAPYADVTGYKLREYDGLSEEDFSARSVRQVVDELMGTRTSAVLCTHRPVLPVVFDAVGVPETKLEPGGLLVAHLRRGRVVAVEQHTC